MSAGCQSVSRHSPAPSPDGSVIASIDRVDFDLMGPEPIHIYRGAYLTIQRIKQSREPGFTSIQIADKSEYFSRSGGLYWSPNGRSVAFTTFPNKAIRPETCRLWIVGIYAKPMKNLIAEDVYSFRWVDDTHMVYVTEDGEVYRATISDGGDIRKLEPLCSVGDLRDTDGRLAYHYPGLHDSGGYKFNNPLSPNAQFFVYGDGQNLTIVNLSTATIEKSFPLTGKPIKFWWDDGSSNLLIGVQKKKEGKYGYTGHTHHYYLYQRESGTLTNIINRLEDTSQFSPYEPSGYGRVWLSDGKHFILHSGYPYYKTWLFNTASLSAVWIEREIGRFKDGNFSQPQRLIATLPLEDGEVDSSKEPLPKSPHWDDPNYEKRGKMIEKNSSSRVVIEPSPVGNLLAVRLPEGKKKEGKSTSTCYVLKIVTDPKGEMFLDVVKKRANPE